MKHRWTRIAVVPAVLVLILAACGGGSENSVDTDGDRGGDNIGDTGGENGGENGGEPDANGSGVLGSGDTGVTVTVDGIEYVVDTALGGRCNTAGGEEIAASGYDVATGSRVELSFTRQDAEFSPTGQDAYYGGVFVALEEGGDWQVDSAEQWDWWSDDGSTVSGTVTMENFEGQTVEVSFEIDCP